jgi:hypothetical protein
MYLMSLRSHIENFEFGPDSALPVDYGRNSFTKSAPGLGGDEAAAGSASAGAPSPLQPLSSSLQPPQLSAFAASSPSGEASVRIRKPVVTCDIASIVWPEMHEELCFRTGKPWNKLGHLAIESSFNTTKRASLGRCFQVQETRNVLFKEPGSVARS